MAWYVSCPACRGSGESVVRPSEKCLRCHGHKNVQFATLTTDEVHYAVQKAYGPKEE